MSDTSGRNEKLAWGTDRVNVLVQKIDDMHRTARPPLYPIFRRLLEQLQVSVGEEDGSYNPLATICTNLPYFVVEDYPRGLIEGNQGNQLNLLKIDPQNGREVDASLLPVGVYLNNGTWANGNASFNQSHRELFIEQAREQIAAGLGTLLTPTLAQIFEVNDSRE